MAARLPPGGPGSDVLDGVSAAPALQRRRRAPVQGGAARRRARDRAGTHGRGARQRTVAERRQDRALPGHQFRSRRGGAHAPRARRGRCRARERRENAAAAGRRDPQGRNRSGTRPRTRCRDRGVEGGAAMIARTAAAVVLTLAVSATACGRIKTPPRGGAPELELIKAAAAMDVGKVKQLLASGAGTNGLVPFDRSEHSPWHYALTQ